MRTQWENGVGFIGTSGKKSKIDAKKIDEDVKFCEILEGALVKS